MGVIPENFVEEDPLAPGQPLRRGKSVVHRGLDYSALPLNVRRYMRVAVELGSQHGGIDLKIAVIGPIFPRFPQTELML